MADITLPTPGDESTRDVWGGQINTAITSVNDDLNDQKSIISSKYVKPGSGIPTSDLSSDIQASIAKANDSVSSDGTITDIISLTQSQYDAITPDPNTLYVITG